MRNSYTIPAAPDKHRRHDVVVVGSLNMDLVARARRLPVPGETVLGDDFAMVPGGKGANQAVAAARLGARTAMIGCVGCDAMGDRLMDALDAAGVDAAGVVRIDDQPSGVALIGVDDAGENAIIVVPGANGALDADHVLHHEPLLRGASVVIAQLEVPLPAISTAFEIASAHGATTILDPAPPRPLDDALLRSVDLMTPNESEAAALTGVDVADEEGIRAAAHELLDRGLGAVVITLGRRGALYADGSHQRRIDAFAIATVDATAAGDAFTGALGAALARNAPVTLALREAVAAGALAATRPGASSSLPTTADVRELLAAAAP